MENKEVMMDILTVAHSISRAGKELLNSILEKYNISYMEYGILRHIEKTPGETQYNFLKYMMLTKSRANQIVSKLEAMGYLQKKIEMVGSLLKKPLYITELGEKIVREGVEDVYQLTIEDLTLEEKLKYEVYKVKMVEILVNIKSTLKVKTPEFLEKK